MNSFSLHKVTLDHGHHRVCEQSILEVYKMATLNYILIIFSILEKRTLGTNMLSPAPESIHAVNHYTIPLKNYLKNPNKHVLITDINYGPS